MRMPAICALTALCAAPAAAEGLLPLSADIEKTFGDFVTGTSDALGDGGDPADPMPSGFDLRVVWLEADPIDRRLRIGVAMNHGAVAGDSDGDGDPDAGTRGRDSAAFGVGEHLRVDLDLDGDGAADAVVRIDADDDLDGCALYEELGPDAAPVSRCDVAEIGAEGPDLVMDLAGFDRLRWSRLPEGADSLTFGIRVIVDSVFDAGPADVVPERGFSPVCPFGGSSETCDGIDEDCDGLIDERPVTPCGAPLADGAAVPEGCSAARGAAPTAPWRCSPSPA